MHFSGIRYDNLVSVSYSSWLCPPYIRRTSHKCLVHPIHPRQFITCSLRYTAKAPGVHITDPSILCAERTNSKLNTKFTLSILGISSFSLFSYTYIACYSATFFIDYERACHITDRIFFTIESLSTVINISPVPNWNPTV